MATSASVLSSELLIQEAVHFPHGQGSGEQEHIGEESGGGGGGGGDVGAAQARTAAGQVLMH